MASLACCVDTTLSRVHTFHVKEREYLRLRRQIEEDYRRKIEALETVWKLSQPSKNSASPESEGAPRPSRGTVDALVRGVLPDLGEVFRPRDVMERLHVKHPDSKRFLLRSSVSSTLRRLVGEQKIEVVEQGSGKRPSRYRVLGASLNPRDFADQPPEVELEAIPVHDDDIPRF